MELLFTLWRGFQIIISQCPTWGIISFRSSSALRVEWPAVTAAVVTFKDESALCFSELFDGSIGYLRGETQQQQVITRSDATGNGEVITR